ncbi:MAG: hypothetical protein EBE86_011575 [Hormoscilla sp. GUM202]|nr:hypothetical protein [Hormoscilla sp. GM7CHS1pb]MBO1347990.1 hypothetical protein [Hormoscilla sp. GUM202]
MNKAMTIYIQNLEVLLLPQQEDTAKRPLGSSYENLIQLISLAKKLDAAYKEDVEKQKERLIRPGVG